MQQSTPTRCDNKNNKQQGSNGEQQGSKGKQQSKNNNNKK
jgi:hypothetical protein